MKEPVVLFRNSCAIVLIVAATGLPARAAEPMVPADHAERMEAGLKLFKSDVRDLLVKHCLECHGGESVKADFNLATRRQLLESGYVDKTAEDSYLLELLRHEAEPHMPFKQPKLADKQIAAIAHWIDLGAPYDKPLVEEGGAADGAMQVTESDRQFWSFQPLSSPAPPEVQQSEWVLNPIDRFVLANLEEAGLEPNGDADARVLLRRAFFDLTGLPPSSADRERLQNDSSPAAYRQTVDQLLASPHYGERWARHWMDVARFAESHGYEQDYDRPHAYHYRDFLIRAFNDDMPYRQFVQWQLAGDELAPEDPVAMAATGFLGAGPFPTQLTEMEFESARYDELDDMVSTTGVAFLGLSVGCARCHDHKFDPIPARDYYRMAATFTKTIRSEIELPIVPGEAPVKVQVSSAGFPHIKHHADDRGYPHFYPETYYLERGDVAQKQEVVEPGYLQVLTSTGAGAEDWDVEPPADWERTPFDRAALAEWITDPENGAGALAARVIVNRLWHHHFGTGLVATPSDFGFQGERPTHPELLDWLAGELIAHDWSIKHIQRLIVTSRTYRQSSAADSRRSAADPDVRLLWRRVPKRLEAEPIRDAMLNVAGLLNEQMYGPGTLDESMRRRSVYFFIKRSQLIGQMMLFDWPEHLVSIGRRASTTIAPQALSFMNNPQTRQYAHGLAARIDNTASGDAINRVFQLALSRLPTDQERAAVAEFLAQQTKAHQATGHANPELLALVDLCQSLLASSEFIYVE